jgi:hypothetical protein
MTQMPVIIQKVNTIFSSKVFENRQLLKEIDPKFECEDKQTYYEIAIYSLYFLI